MTAAPEVVLRYRADDPGLPNVAAVEVIDADLRTWTRVPVGAGRTVVSLPRPGRYLVRGWTPTGRPLEAVVDTGRQTDVVLTPAPRPARPAWGQAVRRANFWDHTGTRWAPRSGMLALPAASAVGLPGLGPGAPVAVQFGDDDGPTTTVLTLQGDDLRVRMWTPDGQLAVAGDDTAAALLGYLHQGDLRSAAILADRSDRGPGGEGVFARVALGYVRFLTGDEPTDTGRAGAGAAGARADQSAGELARDLRDSPDALILSAWSELRSPQPDVRRIRLALLRAHRLGGPVVASGVRLLADGLALLARNPQGLPDGPVAKALAEVRRYQRLLLDAPLTTYPSLTPNVPVPLEPAPVPAPANPEAWILSVHDVGENLWAPLTPSAIRKIGTAERRALQGLEGRPWMANLVSPMRRRLSEVLDREESNDLTLGWAATPVGEYAAAAERALPEPDREKVWRTPVGTLVTRWDADAVEVQGPAEGVVRLRCVVDGSAVTYLVPLAGGQGDRLVGVVSVPAARVRREVTDAALVGVDSLTVDDTSTIRRSVTSAADHTTRLAWRALIRRKPMGDPVTEAILDGLV